MSSRPAPVACLAALLVLAPGTGLAQQPAKSAAATASVAKTPAASKAKSAIARNKKKKKQDEPVTGPIATYPGFRLLDGGGSRVSVALSQKLPITEHKADGKLTYTIQGARVPTSTNRLPLVTTFFKTPVTRIALVERDGDVDLVIDLRSVTTAQFRVVENDRGAELQVDFPKPPADADTDADASATSPGAPAATATSTPAAAPTKRQTKSQQNDADGSY